MVYPYKCVVVVGATAGIGAAMADRFVQDGAKVIAVGRRQERLDSFVKTHGLDKAASIRYDITDMAGMNSFVYGYAFYSLPSTLSEDFGLISASVS